MLIYTGKFLIVDTVGYLLYGYIPVGLYWYEAWTEIGVCFSL